MSRSNQTKPGKPILKPTETRKPTLRTEPAKAIVELAVKGKVTNFGEDVFVQIEGREYPIQWKSHDTWQGKIELPLNRELEYRYVIKRNGQEIGRTDILKRVFSKTQVYDTWGRWPKSF